MKNISLLPTLLTLGNMFCGFASIGYVVAAKSGVGLDPEKMERAGWLILAALVFDAFDGMAARLAKVASKFGAELDSLADVISFGVAPGLMIKVTADNVAFLPRVAWVTSALFVLCAGLRLARFNAETALDEDHSHFEGLPTPAAGCFVASMIVMHYDLAAGKELGAIAERLQPTMIVILKILPLVAVFLAVLMVSGVRYVHAMHRLMKGKEPFDYVAKLLLVAMFAILTKPFSIPLAFGVYIVSGVILDMKQRVASRVRDRVTVPEE